MHVGGTLVSLRCGCVQTHRIAPRMTSNMSPLKVGMSNLGSFTPLLSDTEVSVARFSSNFLRLREQSKINFSGLATVTLSSSESFKSKGRRLSRTLTSSFLRSDTCSSYWWMRQVSEESPVIDLI